MGFYLIYPHQNSVLCERDKNFPCIVSGLKNLPDMPLWADETIAIEDESGNRDSQQGQKLSQGQSRFVLTCHKSSLARADMRDHAARQAGQANVFHRVCADGERLLACNKGVKAAQVLNDERTGVRQAGIGRGVFRRAADSREIQADD